MKIRSLRDQIAGKCVHFNGLVNKTCEAGVDYSTVRVLRGENLGWSFPCIKERATPDAPCGAREWPSEEYIQARLDAIAESDRKMRLAAGLVQQVKLDHKGESWGWDWYDIEWIVPLKEILPREAATREEKP